MSTNTTNTHVIIPESDDFRHWLDNSLFLLKMNKREVAQSVGLSPNVVSSFLRNSKSNMRLDSASKIHAHITDVAAARGVEIPRIQLSA